mmetsp:Transcript_97085/g.279410  ORF Transcript_97085/g.279410 Transcript_97085/m.279410 type:complete len:204 (-) Transcript_97085:1382-1993(-)
MPSQAAQAAASIAFDAAAPEEHKPAEWCSAKLARAPAVMHTAVTSSCTEPRPSKASAGNDAMSGGKGESDNMVAALRKRCLRTNLCKCANMFCAHSREVAASNDTPMSTTSSMAPRARRPKATTSNATPNSTTRHFIGPCLVSKAHTTRKASTSKHMKSNEARSFAVAAKAKNTPVKAAVSAHCRTCLLRMRAEMYKPYSKYA